MPLSPSFSNTRFTNPFAARSTPSAFTTRPARSPSASSTSSSSSFHSTTSSFGGIDAMLSGTPSHGRNNSITSLLSNSSRRPSCFSIVEAEEERAEFGNAKLSILEPRNSVGWWGMRQILEEESIENAL